MTEPVKVNSKKIMLTYGAILGVVSILLSVISYVMGNVFKPHWSIQLLGFLILIAVIVYGLREFKKQNGGFLKLGQALKIGIGITAISSVLGILYFIIFTNLIEPDYFVQYMDFQREAALEANTSATPEQIEQGLEMSKPFMNTGFFAGIQFIMAVFFGFIVSLVAGLVMKRENPHAI